jgi:HAMP domain-containing protein
VKRFRLALWIVLWGLAAYGAYNAFLERTADRGLIPLADK